MQARDTMGNAYYQQALQFEQNYLKVKTTFDLENTEYSKKLDTYFEEEAQGYFGSGHHRPDSSKVDNIKNLMDSEYSKFINALKNGAAHGSKDAALRLVQYGHTIDSNPVVFGLQEKEEIAKAIYSQSLTLKAHYYSCLKVYQQEKDKYDSACRKWSEEADYGYNRLTQPYSNDMDLAKKSLNEAHIAYVNKLRAAAKLGYTQAIHDLTHENIPLEEKANSECLVM